jgi:hypothetical protein
MNNSFAFDAGPRLEIGVTSWYLQPSQSDLPEQLRPHQVNRVEGESVPTAVGAVCSHKELARVLMHACLYAACDMLRATRLELCCGVRQGLWGAGSLVWNRLVRKHGNASGQPLGWYCVETGTPGTWTEIDPFIKNNDV